MAPERVGISLLRLRAPRGSMDALRGFYADTLGLPVEGRDPLTVRAGGTTIEFGAGEGAPYYHFAFNVPENKLAAAKAWLKPRCPLIQRPDGRDEYDFGSWNAHAVYFNDPAGNILEFIARHNLRNSRGGAFLPADILYASEIAVVVDDVPATADDAEATLGLGVFAGSKSEQFAALGDDHRLLIVVKRGREWNSGHGRTAEVWPVKAEWPGAAPARLESAAHGFEINAV
jgi:catechol-2,3-dioxygenase